MKKILYLGLEFDQWQRARRLTYPLNIGIADGLRSEGHKCLYVPSPWLKYVDKICGNETFDQIWVEVVQNPLDDALLKWIEAKAPVRLAILPESLDGFEQEKGQEDFYKERKARTLKRLASFTHTACYDEHDVDVISKINQTIWLKPFAASEKWVSTDDVQSSNAPAIFIGRVYGDRKDFVEEGQRLGLLKSFDSTDGKCLPWDYDFVNRIVRVWLRLNLPLKRLLFMWHILKLRGIRWLIAKRYLKGLRQGCAVVNLPHIVRGYPGRVLDGMSMGVPVISWRIPNCPQTEVLFKDGEEILLFDQDDPQQFFELIKKIQTDQAFAKKLSEQARRSIREKFTAEARVRELLDWIG